MANNFQIDLPPDCWLPDSTNGPEQKCSTSYQRSHLGYDDTTKETARSKTFRMPAAYTGSGTLKAAIGYYMYSAASGTVEFEVSIEAVTPGDALDMNDAESFDTANSGSETVPGTAQTDDEIVVTLTTKDSVAAGDHVRIKLARDATDGTNDTATGDARVISFALYEEA